MTAGAITFLIADAVDDKLVLDLKTAVTGATKAYDVRKGFLQDDPTKGTGVSVQTHHGDPDDIYGWEDGIASGPENDTGADADSYAYSIGGEELWYRRFKTEVHMFWKPTIDRPTAMSNAALVIARAERAIKNAVVAIEDEFGEISLQTYVVSSRFDEAGGPGAHIWHGWIKFQVLTAKYS